MEMTGKDGHKTSMYTADNVAFLHELQNEFLHLFRKYAGGRIPVLVDENDTQQGLVNGELLKIYQRGFTGKNLIPLGILFAKHGYDGIYKWERGYADYHLNKWAKSGWINVCNKIRGTKEGDIACEDCDRKRAKLAENQRDVIAYLCDHGMIDFAMPILVEDKVIAVIFTGQRIPKKGTLWNPDIIEENGLFALDWSEKTGVEAWKSTVNRFEDTEKKYNLVPNTLTHELYKDINSKNEIEVTPEETDEIRVTLRSAGNHLSNLASSTYSLEKSKAVAALRSLVSRAVAEQRVDHYEDVDSTLKTVIGRLSKRVNTICKYFGIDFLLALNLKADSCQFRLLTQHAPVDSPWKTTEWFDLDEKRFKTMLDSMKTIAKQELTDFDLWPLRKLPFFEWVATWLSGKLPSRCVAARLDYSGLTHCILFAGKREGLSMLDFREQDRGDFERIVGDIGMVLNVLLYIDAIRSEGEAQELFLEDVAHDIRNPIQNLLIKVDRLKLSLGESGDVRKQVDKVGAQIRRLDQLSRRVWFLAQIRQKRLNVKKTELVKVHQLIMETVLMLKDKAEETSVGFEVSKDMEKWRSVRINRDFFFHALLNLIDNAVKYSFSSTFVEIYGNMQYPNCTISVVNRGLEIKHQYKNEIYKRGFRTPEASMHLREGGGIGLCIVKAFADHYGDVDFECTQIVGTFDFKTCHSGKPAKSKKSLRRRFFGGGGRSDCSADLRGLTLA